MNAYEYGLKYFKVKYQPQSNCVVFNDRYEIIGEEDEHTKEEYVSSPYTYEQVLSAGNKHFKEMDKPKRFNGSIAEDYLLPNTYMQSTLGNTIEGFPNNLYEVFEYQKEYYVKKSDGTVADEIADVRFSVSKKATRPKIFGLADLKLKEILENTSLSLLFFFTEEGAVLEEGYSGITDIQPNEILFFLEKESLHNPVSVVKVKTGSGISPEIKLPYKSIAALAKLFGVSTTDEQIEEAFKVYFKSTKEEAIDGVTMVLYEIDNFVLQVSSEALRGLLGDPLVILGNWVFSDVLKCKPERWQYYAKDGSKNKNFTPFIPGFKEFLDGKDEKKDGKTPSTIDQLILQLRTQLNEGIKKVPNGDFRKFLFQKLNFVFKILDAVEELYASIVKLISLESHFIAINAFLIGVWNSLMDAIGGILIIVGHIINIPSYLLDKNSKTFSQSIAIGRELLESAVESVLKLFTIANIKALFKGIKAIGKTVLKLMQDPEAVVSKLTDGVNYVATKIDRIGYGVGFVIGFIIEEVLTTLFTGGAKTIAEAFRLTMNSFANTLDSVRKIPSKVAGKASDFIHGFTILFEKLRKLDVPKLIDDFIAWVQYMVKTVKQLAQEKFDELFTNNLAKNRLKKLGYTPTKLDGDIITLCPI